MTIVIPNMEKPKGCVDGCEYEYAMLPNPYIGENTEELKRQFNLFLSNADQHTQCVECVGK